MIPGAAATSGEERNPVDHVEGQDKKYNPIVIIIISVVSSSPKAAAMAWGSMAGWASAVGRSGLV